MNSGQQLIKQFVRDMTHVRTHNSATFFSRNLREYFLQTSKISFQSKFSVILEMLHIYYSIFTYTCKDDKLSLSKYLCILVTRFLST